MACLLIEVAPAHYRPRQPFDNHPYQPQYPETIQMNTIQELKDRRDTLTLEMERIQRDLMPFECAFHAIRPPSPPTSGHPFHAHPARQSERSDAGLHC